MWQIAAQINDKVNDFSVVQLISPLRRNSAGLVWGSHQDTRLGFVELSLLTAMILVTKKETQFTHRGTEIIQIDIFSSACSPLNKGTFQKEVQWGMMITSFMNANFDRAQPKMSRLPWADNKQKGSTEA